MDKLYLFLKWMFGLALFAITTILFTSKAIFSDLEESLNIRDQYDRYQGASLEEINKMPKYDRPDLAIMQNFEMTKDPSLRDVPSERTLRTFQKMQTDFVRARAIDGVTWEERGPDNIGGRTRALMFDPNDGTNRKVWAGSVGGGLWFNNDITSSSSQWQNIDDFLANLAITSIAFDPSNTQVFYAGTGEGYFNFDAIRGAGIWKTIDGGITWTQLPNTDNSDFHYVQKIAITSSGTVLAATRTGLFRSTNGGNTWSAVLSGARYSDIEIGSNGDIYVSRGIFSTGAVLKSTDNGISFTDVTPQSGGERIELAIAPSDPLTVYAVASNNTNVAWFRKTTNGGSTWTNVTIPIYLEQSCFAGSQDFTRGQAWYDLILAVKPDNPNIVLAGGIDIHRSTNGGSSWSSVSYWTGRCGPFVHADQHAMVFRPGSPNAAIFGHDGGVSYSTNVGNASASPTFGTRVNGYNVTQFYAADQINAAGSNFLLSGAQDNGSLRITTSGISSATEVSGGDGAFCHVDQDNSTYQITSFVRNNFFRSTNGGSSFSSILRNNDGRFINPTDYDDAANILYSAGNANQMIRISGITGTPNDQRVNLALGGFSISAIKVSPYTNNRIFVGTGTSGSSGGSSVYRVDNANTSSPTTTQISTSSIPSNGYISSVELGNSDDQILVTLSNFGIISVWETRNGGSSWTNREGNLPDIPIRWGLYNPNNTNEVLLATDLGVWSTDNINVSSPDWGVTNTGLANVRVDMLQYRDSDGQVVVATHGRGLYTGFPFSGGSSGGGGDLSCASIVSSLPYSEGFESGASGDWVQAGGDDGDWVNDANGTPSNNTGPSSADEGSRYLFLEASTNGSVGQIGNNATAILESPCFNLTGVSSANFTFSYHMFGTNTGSLVLEATTDGTNYTQLFSRSGNQGDAWFSETVSMSSFLGDTVQLRLVGTTGPGFASDIAIDNLSMTSGSSGGGNNIACVSTITSFPYSESFEGSIGQWVQAGGDDGDWVNDANGTPSSNTGPSSAIDGSSYMFIESSNNSTFGAIGFNATAILESPCFDLTNESVANFNFNYHMFGSNMGTLRVDVTTDGTTWTEIWSRSGNQGNSWFGESLSLSAYLGNTIKLRFRGTTGASWRSDMAIDNVGVSSSATPSALIASSFIDTPGIEEDVSIRVFPNSVSDLLHISMRGFTPSRYTLVDLSGKIINAGVITSEKDVDMTNLESGYFILKIENEEEVKIENIFKR